MDRNTLAIARVPPGQGVALREESVDRNALSDDKAVVLLVALREESVDRNANINLNELDQYASLSARRAWIEMASLSTPVTPTYSRSPRGERG